MPSLENTANFLQNSPSKSSVSMPTKAPAQKTGSRKSSKRKKPNPLDALDKFRHRAQEFENKRPQKASSKLGPTPESVSPPESVTPAPPAQEPEQTKAPEAMTPQAAVETNKSEADKKEGSEAASQATASQEAASKEEEPKNELSEIDTEVPKIDASDPRQDDPDTGGSQPEAGVDNAIESLKPPKKPAGKASRSRKTSSGGPKNEEAREPRNFSIKLGEDADEALKRIRVHFMFNHGYNNVSDNAVINTALIHVLNIINRDDTRVLKTLQDFLAQDGRRKG